MNNFRKSSFSKFVSVFTAVAFLSVLIAPASFVQAASITGAMDILSRQAASTASDHTIYFVTPTGIATTQNVTLTFSAGTGIASLVGADFDFAESTNSTCVGGSFTEKSVVNTSPSSAQFSITGTSSTVVTITSGGSSATVTAGHCVRLKIGLNATDTTGSGPGTHQITNPVAGNYTVTIGGSFGDSGTITLTVDDSDQVSVTANVNQTISFDLDANDDFSSGESVAPYSVALGTLATGSVTESNTSSVKMIVAEGDTNASGGMNVTVQNANGTDGLKSISTPTDKITSSTGTMAAGTTNYGLCVATVNLAGFSRATGTYASDTCALSSGTNQIRALSATPANILTSAGVLSGGHAEIVVNAAIAGSIPAHNDYADTLTFIATSTF